MWYLSGWLLDRSKEAESTASDVICVGCPFCKTKLNDAGNELESKLEVKDIAEILAERLE
jgi:Fe-S oxidoreductase